MYIPKNASVLIIVFFCLLSLTAKAQYKGGSGDGYAMAEISSITLGEPELSAENQDINIYPNPVSKTDNINITVNGASLYFKDITICNMYGAQVLKTNIHGGKNISLNLSPKHFPAGIYIVKLSAEDGRSVQRKLLIN